MIQTAEADIISPSITTEDPLGLLSQEVLICYDVLAGIAINTIKSCNQLVSSRTIQSTDTEGIQPLLASSLHLLSRGLRISYSLNFLL